MIFLRKLIGSKRPANRKSHSWVSELLEKPNVAKGIAFTIFTMGLLSLGRLLFFNERNFAFSTYVYIKLLGSVLLTAFISLWVQIIPLIGIDGISPITSTMSMYRSVIDESENGKEEVEDEVYVNEFIQLNFIDISIRIRTI